MGSRPRPVSSTGQALRGGMPSRERRLSCPHAFEPSTSSGGPGMGSRRHGNDDSVALAPSTLWQAQPSPVEGSGGWSATPALWIDGGQVIDDALECDLSAYDAGFVVLARTLGVRLVTLDGGILSGAGDVVVGLGCSLTPEGYESLPESKLSHDDSLYCQSVFVPQFFVGCWGRCNDATTPRHQLADHTHPVCIGLLCIPRLLSKPFLVFLDLGRLLSEIEYRHLMVLLVAWKNHDGCTLSIESAGCEGQRRAKGQGAPVNEICSQIGSPVSISPGTSPPLCGGMRSPVGPIGEIHFHCPLHNLFPVRPPHEFELFVPLVHQELAFAGQISGIKHHTASG